MNEPSGMSSLACLIAAAMLCLILAGMWAMSKRRR